MAINNNNKFRCWAYFAVNNQEELYNVISLMIKDYIDELLPNKISEFMKLNTDLMNVKVTTFLNGKYSNLDGLKEDIEKLIVKSM